MEMTEEEFDRNVTEALDTLLEAMAESSEVDLQKFYSMACIMENLRYFTPVLYSALQQPGKQ